MTDEQIIGELNNLYHDPAWKYVIDRLNYTAVKVDEEFHKSEDYKGFLINKGRFEMVKEIIRLLKDPKNLVDNGVRVFGKEAL